MGEPEELRAEKRWRQGAATGTWLARGWRAQSRAEFSRREEDRKCYLDTSKITPPQGNRARHRRGNTFELLQARPHHRIFQQPAIGVPNGHARLLVGIRVPTPMPITSGPESLRPSARMRALSA